MDIDSIITAVAHWVSILDKQDRGITAASVSHSSLLKRLIEDKKVYDFIPPLSYSYPWYSLLDSGFEMVTDVHWGDNFCGVRGLWINQSFYEAQEDSGSLILRYRYIDGEYCPVKFRLTREIASWKMEVI